MTEAKKYLQAFASVPGVGAQTLRYLQWFQRQQRLSWYSLWQKSSRLVLTVQQDKALQEFKQQFSPEGWADWLDAHNITCLIPTDQLYPVLLRHCPDKPEVLFVKGNTTVLEEKNFRLPLSIVGTRRMTSYGAMVTDTVVEQLVSLQPTIISGFMTGVDTQAHQAALKNNLHSVGILGYAIDGLYPESLASWHQEFLAGGGVLMSEYAPGTIAHKGLFRLRNRIVAGTSYATIITEAGYPSGTFITANFAADYGRLVAAVPTPIAHPFYEGIQKLLDNGVFAFDNSEEFWSELQPSLLVKNTKKVLYESLKVGNRSQKILHHVLLKPQNMPELINNTQLHLEILADELLMLEKQKLIAKVGNYWYANPLKVPLG